MNIKINVSNLQVLEHLPTALEHAQRKAINTVIRMNDHKAFPLNEKGELLPGARKKIMRIIRESFSDELRRTFGQ